MDEEGKESLVFLAFSLLTDCCTQSIDRAYPCTTATAVQYSCTSAGEGFIFLKFVEIETTGEERCHVLLAYMMHDVTLLCFEFWRIGGEARS